MTEAFDYIIVGAGSAGCVLANRLTADHRNRVLLLEAGGSDARFWITVPIGYGKTFYDRRVNWSYETEIEPGLAGRSSYWPRGKVLGGSSSINAMVYVRGNPADYDDWAAMDCAGWGWSEVEPYFRKMESWRGEPSELRGSNGPLSVSDTSREIHPLCDHYLQAAQEAGLKRNPDYNGASMEGVGPYQITVRDGRRASASQAYLRPAMGRKNLTVVTNALVEKVLIEEQRASGVRYRHGGRVREARANVEVIISAGAVNSPQVLQLSGIGEAEKLRDLGIPPILDAPQVGKNLQDHLGIDYHYRANRPTLNSQLRPWWSQLLLGARYLLTRGGPLALSVNQAGGFVRSDAGRSRPNMQLYFSPLTFDTAPTGTRPVTRVDPYPAFRLGVSPCRPLSRGWLSIRSPDPTDAPEIRPGYLSVEEDVEEMLSGVRLIRRLAAMPGLSEVIAEEMQPGPIVSGDDQLREDIHKRAWSVFHPCGTCRMGSDPSRSVVDPSFRVHGLRGMRVVDASVFPTVTSGNINGPVIMVAERASNMILADRNR
ncbi:GMC family oxidoreductase [Limibacillus halophilus]|uniref:Choline dehydrogenase n=1 Tax=Limibacillus halophilus TaxID=1579333 RepID=A0A839SX20_9PROT|nr:choline dehydrogenase [Limibacillus halophilus]MBB3066204.1 choline dehydrogenase [Limibacillus halophilus]